MDDILLTKTIHHDKNNGVTNAKKLFHGTSGTNSRHIAYGRIGFDVRFSKDGMWGKANYFTTSAAYADRFAHICEDGTKEIIFADVLTGSSCYMEPDHTIRFPPMMTADKQYDSVTRVTGGSRVYMTYDSCKAYPT